MKRNNEFPPGNVSGTSLAFLKKVKNFRKRITLKFGNLANDSFRIMSIFLLLFIAKMSFFLEEGKASEKWKKINDEEGVEVFSRDVKGTSLVAFRGITDFDEPMEKIMWVLKDEKRRKDWVARYLKGATLEKKGPFEQINYQAVTAPWPVSNRDMIYSWKANRLSDGDIQIELKSVDYPNGPDTVGVRMKLHFSRFILNRRDNGGTRVTLEILSDPMGLIPKWVVNMIQKNYPVKFFRALKKQVKKPFVKKGTLP